MSESHLKYLSIKNFKSIKDLKIDCRRINIFLGKPNVGKSNILEAVGLYGAPYSITKWNKFFQNGYLRFDDLRNLFHFNDRKESILVDSNISKSVFRFDSNTEKYLFYSAPHPQGLKAEWDLKRDSNEVLDKDFINKLNSKQVEGKYPSFAVLMDENCFFENEIPKQRFKGWVRKYDFLKYSKANEVGSEKFDSFLLPNHGNNLYQILNSNHALTETVSQYFEEYNLEFVLDEESNKFLILKREGKVVKSLPFSLIADTLQRIIFHLAAIKSNENAVLILEEPEAHSYPVYITMLAQEIIKSSSNQFFIATHSPYLLNHVLENANKEEVAVFVCSYDKHETKAKMLSGNELNELINYGVDIFMQIDSYA
ncbi:MAG: AAA family ATPase [Bacteroidia bacterium]